MTALSLVSDDDGTLFTYESLDRATEVAIRSEAVAIKARLRRTAEDIVEIGSALIRVKARLKHGQFGSWLEAEFGMSERTARKFMSVADRFADRISAVPADLGIEALVDLASSSTPDDIRAEVERRVQAGELVTAAEVKRLRDEARAAREAAEQFEQQASLLRDSAEHAKAEGRDEARREAEQKQVELERKTSAALQEAEAAKARVAFAEAQAAKAKESLTAVEAEADKIADQVREEAAERARKIYENRIADLEAKLKSAKAARLKGDVVVAFPSAEPVAPPSNVVLIPLRRTEDGDEEIITDWSNNADAAQLVYGLLSQFSIVKLDGPTFWGSRLSPDPNIVRWAAHALEIISAIVKEYPNVR